MGYSLLRATPEERFWTIVIIFGMLIISGMIQFYDKRKKER